MAKINPYARVKAENERLSKELRRLRQQKDVEEFAGRMLQDLGVLLALTPFKDWPHLARVAFKANETATPPPAALYLDRLPK